jgi:hypothetical protein
VNTDGSVTTKTQEAGAITDGSLQTGPLAGNGYKAGRFIVAMLDADTLNLALSVPNSFGQINGTTPARVEWIDAGGQTHIVNFPNYCTVFASLFPGL